VRIAGENRTVLRGDADFNAAAESADQAGWSRLNTRRGKLSGVSTKTVSIIRALTQSNGECARSTPFINGGSENPDLQVTLAIVPDHAHREINPAGTTAGFLGFPKRWRGIIGKIRVPLPENLLVKWRSHASRGFNLSSMYLL